MLDAAEFRRIAIEKAPTLPALGSLPFPSLLKTLGEEPAIAGSWRIRSCIAAGEPVPAKLIEAWQRTSGVSLLAHYGLTEGGQITLADGDGADGVGRPLSDVEVQNELPDLVAHLGGQLDLDLAARIGFADGRVRIVMNSLPDMPISKLFLTTYGGRRGLFVNNRQLCAAPSFATGELVAQNGKRSSRQTRLRVPCG